MIKVLIVDDHALIRDGIRKILDVEPDMRILGEARNAAQTMELLRTTSPDILVLDIGLPDRDGIEVLKDIKAAGFSVAVLMLSMYPESRYAKRAVKNGAAGYLTKDSASDEIVTALRTIHSTGVYITERVAGELYHAVNHNEKEAPHESLSDREYQIFLLIGNAHSSRTIAETLGLSINTINSYRRRVMTKMDLNSNAEIIKYTTRHNLLKD